MTPLLYAVDADKCEMKAVKKLERCMRIMTWGKSRPASCWQMVLALDAPPHWLSLTCRSFLEAAQVLRAAAQVDHLRADLFQLWQESRIPRTSGMWSCFARGLLRAGVFLGEPGSVGSSRWYIDCPYTPSKEAMGTCHQTANPRHAAKESCKSTASAL